MPKISIVVPIYNEEESIPYLYERLIDVLKKLKEFNYEIILVNDGSTDNSQGIIKELLAKDQNVKYISFSRNFGHEKATTAGFDKAEGDCVVLIDADLQDPPEVILEMVEKWQEGYQVVYAQRKSRAGESFMKKVTSLLFYRMINIISDSKIPMDTGDFRLVDRHVLLEFRKMGEYNRMVRGMIAWLGFKQVAVRYERDERKRGQTKYNFFKLLWLAFDAITSFSIMPLRFATGIGFLVILMSIAAIIIVICQKVFLKLPIPGYAFQTVSMFFLGGIQLFILGIMGEYLGKIFQQAQKRPLYIIEEEGGFERDNGNTGL
jgi:polyisoprenyl-phosphate glycosyltransferase